MKRLKKLLLPFSYLHGLITWVRNFFYDKGIYTSKKFDVPMICVGNLNTGGTGKTPHVEYIINLLKNNSNIAVLSRGYRRRTKGFLIYKSHMNSEMLGDEPYQFAIKFPEIIVAVGEDRRNAVKNLLSIYPGINAIILDDGFQHRAVKPGLSVLLSDYSDLFTEDYLLPAGNLRESGNGYKRADLIVVTKCPALSQRTKQKVIEEISPLPHQKVLFSFFHYDALIPFSTEKERMELNQLKEYEIVLLTGLANPKSINDFLKDKTALIHHLEFPDHHQYTKDDISMVRKKFDNIATQKKIIVTTEKDFVRLKSETLHQFIHDLPFYYLPVQVDFDADDKKNFDETILSYVGKN